MIQDHWNEYRNTSWLFSTSLPETRGVSSKVEGLASVFPLHGQAWGLGGPWDRMFVYYEVGGNGLESMSLDQT